MRSNRRLLDHSRLLPLTCSTTDGNLTSRVGDKVAQVSAARHASISTAYAVFRSGAFGYGRAALRRIVVLGWLAMNLSPTWSAAPVTVRETTLPGQTKFVLVELFTSQGCNLCPDAERLLGNLADRNRRIVPIAYHVDYFNSPWPDPFSDRLYSERQMMYHMSYTKPKPAGYGLYYTPMLMVDGAQSLNGRDRIGAETAIRQALMKEPEVALQASLVFGTQPASGDLRVVVAARSSAVARRQLVVAAVLRDDGLTNRVYSGENANRVLVARHPARKMLSEPLILEGPAPQTCQFKFTLNSEWDTNKLRVAVFVQDTLTWRVYQALDLPWRARSDSQKAGQSGHGRSESVVAHGADQKERSNR
jgi:hypothetical protein